MIPTISARLTKPTKPYYRSENFSILEIANQCHRHKVVCFGEGTFPIPDYGSSLFLVRTLMAPFIWSSLTPTPPTQPPVTPLPKPIVPFDLSSLLNLLCLPKPGFGRIRFTQNYNIYRKISLRLMLSDVGMVWLLTDFPILRLKRPIIPLLNQKLLVRGLSVVYHPKKQSIK